MPIGVLLNLRWGWASQSVAGGRLPPLRSMCWRKVRLFLRVEGFLRVLAIKTATTKRKTTLRGGLEARAPTAASQSFAGGLPSAPTVAMRDGQARPIRRDRLFRARVQEG